MVKSSPRSGVCLVGWGSPDLFYRAYPVTRVRSSEIHTYVLHICVTLHTEHVSAVWRAPGTERVTGSTPRSNHTWVHTLLCRLPATVPAYTCALVELQNKILPLRSTPIPNKNDTEHPPPSTPNAQRTGRDRVNGRGCAPSFTRRLAA